MILKIFNFQLFKTRLDPILLPVLNLCIRNHGSIALDDSYLTFFSEKKVYKEVGYNGKRG